MRISDWSSDVCSSDLMFDVRRADAESDHAERAVSGRMAVARGDDHAGQHETEFGHHDMLDPLPRIEEIEDFDPEIAALFAQIFDLPPRAFEIGGASCRAGVCQYG